MNKFVATCLESRLCLYDARTQHPTRGFAGRVDKVRVSQCSGWHVAVRAVGTEAKGPVVLASWAAGSRCLAVGAVLLPCYPTPAYMR